MGKGLHGDIQPFVVNFPCQRAFEVTVFIIILIEFGDQKYILALKKTQCNQNLVLLILKQALK